MKKTAKFILILVLFVALLPAYSFANDLVYSVNYKITSQWETGFSADITISNLGSAAIEDWELEFYFQNQQKITSLWNGSYIQNNNRVTINSASWNQIIGQNQSITIGFVAEYSGENRIPDVFSLKSKGVIANNDPENNETDYNNESNMGSEEESSSPEDDSAEMADSEPTDEQEIASEVDNQINFNIEYKVTSDWGSGFGANISLNNSGESLLENWSLIFFFADQQKITSLWNGSFTQSANKVTIKSADWNSIIQPGETVQIGFNANYSGANRVVEEFLLAGQVITPEEQNEDVANDPIGTEDDSIDTGQDNESQMSSESDGFSYSVMPDYSIVDVGKGIADWPDRVFAPFVDSTLWPIYQLSAEAEKNKVQFYSLGFIVAKSASDGTPTWGTYYEAEQGPRSDTTLKALNDPNSMQSQIKQHRQNGGDVMVSFGGAANIPIAAVIKDVEELKEQYKQFILAYDLTHIDFDIEGNWVADKSSIDRRSKALTELQAEFKEINRPLEVWYTLPVLPSGLTADGIYVLRSALENEVKIAGVNIMAMDYGDSAAPNPQNQMGYYAIEAASSLHLQLKNLFAEFGISQSESDFWGMIGITPMIGLNDVTTEVFYQEDAKEVVNFAKEKGIRLLSMWSLARDKSAPSGEAASYVSVSNSSIKQYPYEFSHLFNLFMN